MVSLDSQAAKLAAEAVGNNLARIDSAAASVAVKKAFLVDTCTASSSSSSARPAVLRS